MREEIIKLFTSRVATGSDFQIDVKLLEFLNAHFAALHQIVAREMLREKIREYRASIDHARQLAHLSARAYLVAVHAARIGAKMFLQLAEDFLDSSLVGLEAFVNLRSSDRGSPFNIEL